MRGATTCGVPSAAERLTAKSNPPNAAPPITVTPMVKERSPTSTSAEVPERPSAGADSRAQSPGGQAAFGSRQAIDSRTRADGGQPHWRPAGQPAGDPAASGQKFETIRHVSLL